MILIIKIKMKLAKILSEIAISKQFRVMDKLLLSSNREANFKANEDIGKKQELEKF